MNKVAKNTLILMIITIISKILGFIRELVLGGIYGTTFYSDAYIVAMNIPGTLFSLIGIALSTTFIPLYYENSKSVKESNKFVNNIFNITLILSAILALLVFVFANQVVKIFAIGFNGDTFKLTVEFTKIIIVGALFMGTSSIFTSFLQAKENFTVPGLVGIPFNIIIIIAIILSSKISIYILPIGTVIAMLSRLLFQMPSLFKYGYRYKFTIGLKEDYIKKVIWLVGPVFIGVAVNQINTMVDRTLASTLLEGSISALNYANRLNSFVMGLFIMSIGTVIYPILSKLSANSDKESFIKTVYKSVNIVTLLVIPISIGAMVLATPIVSLLFERGAFDSRATDITAKALVFYSIGMVGFGLRDILGKVFYSLQDTKTPMINGAIAIGMNIILNLILVKFMGHAGLAFATSISAIACIFILFKSLKKKIGYFGQDKILKTTFKSLIASILMGIITYVTYSILSSVLVVGFIQQAISLFGSIAIGALVYGILVVILKVEEASMVINFARKKLKI
ncbi:murein biosynthesis integral membrane protein MurJ [Romboutsia sedimentorum]|uniref:murein biosynthesis integral membrane protein MurJ n=1 Tax=Romboutsia sedimentorum TaxID=1368474 RepID=UPI0024DEA32A|nr:murein biosynthesis integral membrane protein MurJ [Romboutsia sedimentorum]MDK2584495.1 murein biosynthesis integral membrane protein MurJ [Romboutsia sedimentorum]